MSEPRFKPANKVGADEQWRVAPSGEWEEPSSYLGMVPDRWVEVRKKPAKQWRPNGDAGVSWGFGSHHGKGGELTFEVWIFGFPYDKNSGYARHEPDLDLIHRQRDRLIDHLNATGFRP